MNKLVIFNLQTDANSSVLAASIDWIEEFRNHFSVTDVVSTHVGKTTEVKNVRLLEIGGGSQWARIVAVLILTRFALYLIPRRKNCLIFHHMSPRTAVFPGILFKAFRIPQGLWYSHSSKPYSLMISARIVDFIFSSEKNSLPVQSSNAHYVGHGISLKRFGVSQPVTNRKNAVLFIGRISPIKNIFALIDEVSLLDSKIPIKLIGPQFDSKYAKELLRYATEKGIPLSIDDSVTYDKVPFIMSQYKYFYSGMKLSVDKSSLEAAISGCFVLTTDLGTQKLSGMRKLWEMNTPRDLDSIHKQIQFLETISARELNDFQGLVRNEAIIRNSLEKTILKMASLMKSKL